MHNKAPKEKMLLVTILPNVDEFENLQKRFMRREESFKKLVIHIELRAAGTMLSFPVHPSQAPLSAMIARRWA